MDAFTPALDLLLSDGLLIESGVNGLYGRSGVFEDVLQRVEALTRTVAAQDGAMVMRFPPGMSRAAFERSGYIKNFPHLAGVVRCFCGDEPAHRALMRSCDAGEDWGAELASTDVVLAPAACYPVYPALAQRGVVPDQGWLVDVAGYCFRHEPSREVTRMQWFRMQEFVRVGTEAQVLAFRQEWMARAGALAQVLGLPHELEVANDPFFGRAGKLQADGQREKALKFELVIPVNPGAPPTACGSFNYHGEHFGRTWGLQLADGSTAHTCCVGFGLERLTVALFRQHGSWPGHWPDELRGALWSLPC